MNISFLKDKITQAFKFTKDVSLVIKKHTLEFINGCWQYAETITILTLSSIGLTSLLSEIPFYYTIPMWIESPMVIPVVSVLCILALVKIAERRGNKKEENDAAVVTAEAENNLVFSA